MECIHGNSWKQWVHSCPLSNLPIPPAATPTRVSSTCFHFLTCSLDRFMAPGGFCSSWLPSWPSSGGMTLEGGSGSPHGSLSSSMSPALASVISMSGSRTGYFCPCMQTMVCEGRNQSRSVSINLECSFQAPNGIDNRSSRLV